MHLNYSTICGAATCHELVKREKSGLEVVNPDKFVRISSGKQDLISTVWETPHPAMPTWTNTLPRHFRRGPASHKPFDFLPSIYPFYMFLAAKTLSVHRRVHNHYTKRILNLILNRKKFCGGETRWERGKCPANPPRRARLRLSNGYHVQRLARKKKLVCDCDKVVAHRPPVAVRSPR